ncbi:hypothetical protein D0962_04660 [Leptolyngbyaceae cyanobacterium CCMR0082]|uniref:Uncharacterized protein n=1 Tax=Adonisia turfae CCMR0082 TaxID=2304604 RepID=A0A6M0S279_9CYAN|nr:hypothetical protein [Adonisia turfae]NEZ62071.1 hypothetical protein [Adonisia turfae CCMR0082]
MAATNTSSTSPEQKLQRRGRGRRIEAYAYFKENKNFGMLSEKDPRSVKIKHAAFFQKSKWWEDLKSIDISAAGNKGGVIFIHTHISGRDYAIKVTDAPQQVKFAEHLLLTLGKAKIPKSIILSVKDNSVVNSTTNLLMNFIKERGKKNDIPPRVKYYLEAKEIDGQLPDTIEKLEKKQENTVFVGKYYEKYYVRIFHNGSRIVDRKIVGTEAGELNLSAETIQKLDAVISSENVQDDLINALAREIIDKESQGSKHEYQPKKRLKYESFLNELQKESNHLVVMKLIKGDSLSESAADLWNWADKYYPGINPVTTLNKIEFTNLKQISCGGKKIIGESYNDLKKIIDSIYKNKLILADEHFMNNLGRILAVDSLLGNADRFESMNVGNAIFLKRNYNVKDNKTNNPIGVIDNDSFLPIFMGDNKLHLDIEKRGNNKLTKLEDKRPAYIDWSVDKGYELNPQNDMRSVSTSRIKFLLEEFETWFLEAIYNKFYLNDPISKATYGDSGDLIGKSKYYKSFMSDEKDESWEMVKKNILLGFVAGLEDIKKNAFFDSAQSEYNKLFDEYGFTDDFDLIALDVRRCYMAQASVQSSGKDIKIKFDHQKAIGVVKKECFPIVDIPDFINNSIQYCISQGLESRSGNDQLNKHFLNQAYISKNLSKTLKGLDEYILNQLQQKYIKKEDYMHFRFLCTYAFLKIFDADEVIFKSYLRPKVRIELFSSKVRFWTDRLCWVFKNSKKMSKAVSSVLKEFAEASHVNDVDLYHKLSKDALYNSVHKTVEN